MASWAFAALGDPAPQGSKTPKGRTKTGRSIMVESSKKVGPWRDTVTMAALGAGPMLEGPVMARAVFTLSRPKSAPKKVHYPFHYPDCSKILRSTEDSITGAGLWEDDARVVSYERLSKVFPGTEYWDDMECLPVPGVVFAAISQSEGSSGQRFYGEDAEELIAVARRACHAIWARFAPNTAPLEHQRSLSPSWLTLRKEPI